MSNSFQIITKPVESRDIASTIWCNTEGVVDHNLFPDSPVRLITHRRYPATLPMIAIGVAMDISQFFYGGNGAYPFLGSSTQPRFADNKVQEELEKSFEEAVTNFFELQVDRDIYLSVRPAHSGATAYNQNDVPVSLVFEVQITFTLDDYMRMYLKTEQGKNEEYAPLTSLAEALKPFKELFEQKIVSGILFDDFQDKMRIIRNGNKISSFICDSLLGH